MHGEGRGVQPQGLQDDDDACVIGIGQNFRGPNDVVGSRNSGGARSG